MSKKITAMNHGQGFSANVTTAMLVVAASVYGLPVSTTHVAVGSLFGIGLTSGRANPRVVGAIVLSWLITLPCAAIVGGRDLLAHKIFPRMNRFAATAARTFAAAASHANGSACRSTSASSAISPASIAM